MEELRRLSFKCVADELEDPPDDKQCQGNPPEAMREESCYEDSKGKQNRGDTQSVAQAIDGMLVAGRVLLNPLLAGASA